MSGMKLFKGEFKKKLDLLIAPQIKAGFPSPVADYLQESIDFNRDLIKHPPHYEVERHYKIEVALFQ